MQSASPCYSLATSPLVSHRTRLNMAPSTTFPQANDADVQLINDIMADQFSRCQQDYSVRPMEKAKNNKVYLVELNSPTPVELAATKRMPLTHMVPRGTTRFVVRMPKANVSLEDSVRVRNQVVFVHLAQQALCAVKADQLPLAPLVFAWSDDDADKKWVVEEFKQGEHITSAELANFTPEQQHFVFANLPNSQRPCRISRCQTESCMAVFPATIRAASLALSPPSPAAALSTPLPASSKACVSGSGRPVSAVHT